MILPFARSSSTFYNSLARNGGIFYPQFPVSSEQRRISYGSCRRPVKYNYRWRTRASTDDSENIIRTRKEQEMVLPRNSKEQQQLNSNGSPFGELYKLLEALYVFSRPYTVMGTVISVNSLSLLPLKSLAEVSPVFFVEVLKVIILFILGLLYTSGINQIYDIEIDKVNKPYLPLASGVFSMEFGIALTCMTLLGCVAMGIMSHSPPLLFGALVTCLLGSAYSIELPFLRWKKNPFLAPMCIVMVRAVAIPFATFIHIQKYVLGRSILISKSLIFTSCFSCLFSIVVALSKDIPDIDGDRLFGLHSLFTVRLGKERVFLICISTLMLIYGCAIGIGASSTFLVSKIVTGLGHFVLACIVLHRALSLDLSIEGSGSEFYMFVWKLMYAEYLLVPFVR